MILFILCSYYREHRDNEKSVHKTLATSGNAMVFTSLVDEVDEIETEYGLVPIIKVEDIIKDRLAAYLHWGGICRLACSTDPLGQIWLPTGA